MTVVLLVSVFLAALALTAFLRRHALNGNLIDFPNERSSHTIPTPSGGGMSIVMAVSAALLILWAPGLLHPSVMAGLLLGGVLIAGIGYLDDRREIPPGRRLAVHLLAAMLLVVLVGPLPAIPFLGQELALGLLASLFAVLLVIWLLNLYNFMDGIDGLAGVEAVTVFGGAAALLWLFGEPIWALVAALYAAAALGFLPWNWPPARIFMGDGGSGFMGFSFGALLLYTFAEVGFPLWSWLILLSVFIVDATFTLIRRMLRREQWYRAHRNHAYQHAVREMGGHAPVTITVAAINLLWLFPLAWAAMLHPKWGLAWLLIAWLPLVPLAVRFRAGLPEQNS